MPCVNMPRRFMIVGDQTISGMTYTLSKLSVQAPLTRQHYTVDMFLAVVVCCLVWHAATRWTYKGEPVRWRYTGEPSDPRQRVLTALILGVLGIVGYIIIVGGA